MKNKNISSDKAFEILFSNSKLGSMIDVKTELKNSEISIEDIEKFAEEVYRNSLILFNTVNRD